MKFEHASVQTGEDEEDTSLQHHPEPGDEDDSVSTSSDYATVERTDDNGSAAPNAADEGGLLQRRLASLDGGIHSGVPTRTTATLTPTTLRNIEQTFYELTNETPSSVPCQAGFVAPLPSFHFEPQSQLMQQQQQHQQHLQQQQHHQHQDLSFLTQSQHPQQQLHPLQQQNHQQHSHQQLQLQNQQLQQQQQPQQLHQLQLPQHQVIHQLALSQHGGDESNDSYGSEDSNSSSWTSPPPTLADDSSLTGSGPNTTSTPSRRNMGGRRPKNASNLTPAEEEKRRVRRERNKKAAARCRQRRVDQTNELQERVAGLEKERQKLDTERQKLQAECDQLSFFLQDHSGKCRLIGGADVEKLDFKQPPVQQQQEQSAFLQQQQQQHHQQHDNSHHHHHNQQQQQQSLHLNTAANHIVTTTSATTINNNNNIHHQQQHLQQHISQVQLPRPIMLPLTKIKVEPHIKLEPQDTNSLDNADDSSDDLLLGPPPAKRMMLSVHNNPIISSSASGGGCDTPTTLNTPLVPALHLQQQRPNRPSSLAVPFAMTPSQCKNIADMAGVSISTPSNGVMFNFESLMDGGTGLTPVSQPLVPSYPTMSNSGLGAGGAMGMGLLGGRNGAGALGNVNGNSNGNNNMLGMDLVTPTSEPSKLVSL